MPDIRRSTKQPYTLYIADYGAVSDGTTDDASAVQAAVTAAGDLGGATVLFPVGTTLIGTTITVPTKVKLLGFGWASSIIKLKNTSNTDGFLLAVSAGDIIFEGLTLDGNRANNASVGSAITDTAASVSGFPGLVIKDCYIKSWNRGTYVQGTVWSGGQSIINSWIVDCKLWGYHFQTDSVATSTFFGSNGIVSKASEDACNVFWNGWKGRMGNCHLYASRRNITGDYANYNTVMNCQLEESIEEAILLRGRGNRWTITGNVFQRVANGTADGVTPPGVANTYDAIRLANPDPNETCSGNIIADNSFFPDDSSPVLFRYGINEEADCNGNIIVRNSLEGAYQTAPIFRSGAATITDSINLPATPSGFPRRTLGEQAYLGRLEVVTCYNTTASPAGEKANTVLEMFDEPGILRYIWLAQQSTGSAVMEAEGDIRIYIDDDATPVVDMQVRDFFCYAPEGGEFRTPRVGRTHRDYVEVSAEYENGAYRYLFMPYRKYCRVEYVNTATTNDAAHNCTLWIQAGYSRLSEAYLETEQTNYKIYAVRESAHAKQTPMTLIDVAGSGQLESIWVCVSSSNAADNGVYEGNIEVYLDGSTYPAWITTGGEDAFNGAFYEVPVSGYPAGSMGTSLLSGTRSTWYRFFLNDPVYFDSNIKVVWNVGQQGQGSIASATLDVGGFVGLWFNTPQTINYETIGTNQVNDDFSSYGAGDIGGSWTQPGAGKWQGGTNTAVYTGSADFDTNPMYRTTSQQDYWVQAKCRVTSTTSAELALFGRGGTPDYYFGNRVNIALKRAGQYDWYIELMDGSNQSMQVKIDQGVDLINTWVDMAMLISGTKVKGYWRKNGDTVWQSVGSLVTAKTGTGAGIGTILANAEVDDFKIYALTTVTS